MYPLRERATRLGHHYTEPVEIYISNGYYICEQGKKIIIDVDSFCEADLHYLKKKCKKMIPKNTVVKINYYFFNFYGGYVNVTYKKNDYDIPTKSLRWEKGLND